MLNLTVRSKWTGLCGGLCLGLLSAPLFTAQAATLSTLFAFDLHQTAAGVVEGTGSNLGALFGTTSDTTLSYGGSIYKVGLNGGAPQIIYQLQSNDGYSPQAALLASSDGNLYGTTRYAARSGTNLSVGAGTVFRITQAGTGFTTLHTFNVTAHGAYPDRQLIEDATWLYGVTTLGGNSGTGTAFRLRKSDGFFQVLHHFAAIDGTGANSSGTGAIREGAFPASSLTLSGGRLYGVTSGGGANLKTISSGTAGLITTGTGTLYSLNVDGTGFTTHYNFSALDDTATDPNDSTKILSYNTDGVQPSGTLLEVSPGVLWGVTSDGGNPAAGTATGYGTVFSYNSLNSTLTAVHAFNNDNGAVPSGTLVKDRLSGVIYGATLSGSATTTPVRQFGGLFRITPGTGVFAEEYTLAFTQGSNLTGGLIQASDNDLYTTTSFGNACTSITANGYGAVLRYSLATNANAAGYSSCTQFQSNSNSGGGALQAGWLWLLAALGLVPVARRFRRG